MAVPLLAQDTGKIVVGAMAFGIIEAPKKMKPGILYAQEDSGCRGLAARAVCHCGGGLSVAFGWGGLIQLCQAAFIGIGAYTSAILALRFGISLLLAMPAGMVESPVP